MLNFKDIDEFRAFVRGLSPNDGDQLRVELTEKLAYLRGKQVEDISYQDEIDAIDSLNDCLRILDSESAKLEPKECAESAQAFSESAADENKPKAQSLLDKPPPHPSFRTLEGPLKPPRGYQITPWDSQTRSSLRFLSLKELQELLDDLERRKAAIFAAHPTLEAHCGAPTVPRGLTTEEENASLCLKEIDDRIASLKQFIELKGRAERAKAHDEKQPKTEVQGGSLEIETAQTGHQMPLQPPKSGIPSPSPWEAICPQPETGKRGRRPSEYVQVRRSIVKSLMKKVQDFQDTEKIRALFSELDKKSIPLPQRRGPAGRWEPRRWEELLEKRKTRNCRLAIGVLMRDRFPRKTKPPFCDQI